MDTLNGLLGDKEALRKVLLRHVIPGRSVTFQYTDDQSSFAMVILMQWGSRKEEKWESRARLQ